MVKSVTFYHKVQLNRCRLRLRSRSRLGSLQVSPNLAREGREQSLQSLSDLQRQVSSYILIFMMSVFTTIGQSAQRSRPDSTPTHTDTHNESTTASLRRIQPLRTSPLSTFGQRRYIADAMLLTSCHVAEESHVSGVLCGTVYF